MTKQRAWNAKRDRNLAIYKLYRSGASQADIARRFGLSAGRVHGILNTTDWIDEYRELDRRKGEG